MGGGVGWVKWSLSVCVRCVGVLGMWVCCVCTYVCVPTLKGHMC